MKPVSLIFITIFINHNSLAVFSTTINLTEIKLMIFKIKKQTFTFINAELFFCEVRKKYSFMLVDSLNGEFIDLFLKLWIWEDNVFDSNTIMIEKVLIVLKKLINRFMNSLYQIDHLSYFCSLDTKVSLLNSISMTQFIVVTHMVLYFIFSNFSLLYQLFVYWIYIRKYLFFYF